MHIIDVNSKTNDLHRHINGAHFQVVASCKHHQLHVHAYTVLQQSSA